jgi:hypothetical protein
MPRLRGTKVLDSTALTKNVKIDLAKNIKIILDKPCVHARNESHVFGLDGGDYYEYIIPNLLMIDDKKSDFRVPICFDCLIEKGK